MQEKPDSWFVREVRTQGIRWVVTKLGIVLGALVNAVVVWVWSAAEGLAPPVYYVLAWVIGASVLVALNSLVNLWEWFRGARLLRSLGEASPDERLANLLNVQSALRTYREAIENVAGAVASLKDETSFKHVEGRYWTLYRETADYVGMRQAGIIGASWPRRLKQRHAAFTMTSRSPSSKLSAAQFDLLMHAQSTAEHLEAFEEELGRFIS